MCTNTGAGIHAQNVHRIVADFRVHDIFQIAGKTFISVTGTASFLAQALLSVFVGSTLSLFLIRFGEAGAFGQLRVVTWVFARFVVWRYGT
jgi:hypothetical protein